MKPTFNKVPKHIGIILDGNRRFSKRLMLKPWKGHEWGARTGEKIFDWCIEYGIKELTMYVLSEENLNRPKKELDFLINLFRKELKQFYDDPRIEKHKIRVNFIGRLNKLPGDFQKSMKAMVEKTKNNNGFILNFAMAYSGRKEVIEAVKKVYEQVKKGKLDIDNINEEIFSKNLDIQEEADLIIRTGGEKRLSNFLVWQSGYSELIFLDKLFPEFEKEDFIACLQEFNNRDRRFGR